MSFLADSSHHRSLGGEQEVFFADTPPFVLLVFFLIRGTISSLVIGLRAAQFMSNRAPIRIRTPPICQYLRQIPSDGVLLFWAIQFESNAIARILANPKQALPTLLFLLLVVSLQFTA